MRYFSVFVVILMLYSLQVFAEDSKFIQSDVITTSASELILMQEVVINAGINDVWDAYTTKEGWQMWAAPLAEIDLRNGGSIKSQYDVSKKVGDEGTIVVHIVNYVPFTALTLKAELSDRWPEIMKHDTDHLMNLVLFDEIDDNRVKIRSYGVGYRDIEEYHQLLKFFIPANESLLLKLKTTLEAQKLTSPD